MKPPHPRPLQGGGGSAVSLSKIGPTGSSTPVDVGGDPFATESGGDPSPGGNPQPSTAPGESRTGLPSSPAPAEIPQGVSQVAVSALPAPVPTLRFAWPVPVGAAAYGRSGRVWVVFDADTERMLLDRATIAPFAGSVLRRIRTYRRPDAAVLEIETAFELGVRMRRDGETWIAEFVDPPDAPPALAMDRNRGVLRLGGVRRVIELQDPVVGDTLFVATAIDPVAGAPAGMEFVDLAVLPSFQGLAWVRRAPELDAKVQDQELAILRPGGLRLDRLAGEPRGSATAPPAVPDVATADLATPDGPPDPAPTAVATSLPERKSDDPRAGVGMAETGIGAGPAEAHAPFDERRSADARGGDGPFGDDGSFELAEATHAPVRDQMAKPVSSWPLPPWSSSLGLVELEDTDEVTRRELRRTIRSELASASVESRGGLALELARFQLAEGFAREALAALGLVPEGAADGLTARRRAMIAAAALALLDHRQEARTLLAAPEFREDADARLWLGWLDAGAGAWESAAGALERGKQRFESYPAPLRYRFALAALAAAIQTGDIDRSYVWLDQLARAPLPRAERQRVRFFEAMVRARDGDFAEASRILHELELAAEWSLAAESRFAHLELARESGELQPSEIAAALRDERHLWRGHPWEPRVLKRLGELEAESGAASNALSTWREALDRFPERPELADLPEQMRATYVAALDPRVPPDLPPLEALRIRREFAELHPPPPLGTELTLATARAVASMGLPGVARSLLTSEPTQPGMATEVTLLEAELALEQGDPAAALSLLDRLPGETATSPARRLLQARALLAAGRAEEALSALAGLSGVAVERMRADAAWRAAEDRDLLALVDSLAALSAKHEDPLDDLRLARALLVLARHEPERLQAFESRLPAIGVAAFDHLLALVSPLKLAGDARTAVTAVRTWAADTRARLPALRASPAAAGNS